MQSGLRNQKQKTCTSIGIPVCTRKVKDTETFYNGLVRTDELQGVLS